MNECIVIRLRNIEEKNQCIIPPDIPPDIPSKIPSDATPDITSKIESDIPCQVIDILGEIISADQLPSGVPNVTISEDY